MPNQVTARYVAQMRSKEAITPGSAWALACGHIQAILWDSSRTAELRLRDVQVVLDALAEATR